jgi:2-hydroxychromene-2-carboxylate isomerase
MNRPILEFWYDFASTYSYLSAVRIEEATETVGCAVAWRPFLLGPIFKAQGWTTSPFNLYPAKGRYMIRDLTRIAASRGRAFQLPDPFPANSLAAARLALALDRDQIGPFTRALFTAQFESGADIARPDVLAATLQSLGLDPAPHLARIETVAIKDALRDNTNRAMELGIFGAPTFVTGDGELFWGDDRLEQAIAWTRAHGLG